MRDGVVEEGFLVSGSDSVERAECKTEKPAGLGIVGELIRDLRGGFNSLVLDSEATYGNGVKVDIAAAAASIAVGNVPASILDFLGSGTLGDVVEGLSMNLRGFGLRAEHPQVTGTSIEVEVQGLRGSSDLDRGEIGNIILLGSGHSRASVTVDKASRALNSVDQVLWDGLAILAVSFGQSKCSVGLVRWVGNDIGGEATSGGRDGAGQVGREED